MATEISGQIQTIEISGSQLTIAEVAAVARRKRRVQLSDVPEVRKKILASRQILEEKLRRGEILYGVNTGLGGNVRFILPAQDLAKHQQNIFRFLICGSGEPCPKTCPRGHSSQSQRPRQRVLGRAPRGDRAADRPAQLRHHANRTHVWLCRRQRRSHTIRLHRPCLVG